MKTLINTTLAMMAISTSGCATNRLPITKPYKGRIIEFKSGPEGFDTRTFFYEGEHEVVAFDSQFTPELAKQSIAYLRTLTNKPISWLVITHPNPDKFNGAGVFKKEGARVISSKHTADKIPGVQAYKEYYFVEIAKMFAKGTYPQPTSVDQTFEKKMDIVLRGGQRIKLRELSEPGVSSTQTVAYIESENALFVGDLIHNKAHAWLEGGIMNGKPTPTIDGWISDLNELQALYPPQTMVYGGRGLSETLQASVKEQIEYLKTAVLIINNYFKKLGASVQDFNGPNASALYKELTKEFQNKFPEYDLAYMIEYGSYGLVQHELQKK
jgi:glyoxylase-like metal-dependent hydrolase (beta-lactamase superfamily II)